LREGLIRLYCRETGAKQTDLFPLDAKTWAEFEAAALPEMACFNFVEKKRGRPFTPGAALAEAMKHIWMLDDKQLSDIGRQTTNGVIGALATYVCSGYEVTAVDRRNRNRNSLGLNQVG